MDDRKTEALKKELKKSCAIRAVVAAGLAGWYISNSAPSEYGASPNRYSLPSEIVVNETSLPYTTRLKPSRIKEGEDLEKVRFTSADLEKVIQTKDIDFSKDFEIKTDRYRLVKANDWLPSRAIGHVLSLPKKLFFWDWDISLGQDSQRARATLSMLEGDKDIKDLTVRVNHTEAFYDWYRMMTDKKLTERNPFLYRALIGTLTTVGNELWAEFGRGDYYNPLTRTVVSYSNVESIPAHEIGHNKDFSRFSTDWVYGLSRAIPPVMVYQEWKASDNARGLIIKKDDWQFNRYLIPALGTYVLGAWGMMKKYASEIGKMVSK